jgi:hypothetical protein
MSLKADCRILAVSRDWLDVRVPLAFDDAREFLACSVASNGQSVREIRDWTPLGRLGYKSGCEVVGPANSGSLRLMGNHSQSRGWSMFSASQHCADWLHDTIEQAMPKGWVNLPLPQVNRVDVAVDFMFPLARVSDLFGSALTIADTYELRRYREGIPEAGETFTFGWSKLPEHKKTSSPSMPIYSAVLYQKGLQQGANLNVECAPSADWNRYEMRYRPDKVADKERAFSLTPHNVLSGKDWSIEFLAQIGYDKLAERVRMARPDVVTFDDEKAIKAKAMRTLGHMSDQYARSAQDLAKLVGWDRVQDMIMDALKHDDHDALSRPGDMFRRQADMLWVDRFDKRFCAPARPFKVQ